MTKQSITRDERTISVENASYRLAYLLMAFGVLLSVAYRAFALRESSWDLLALVVLSGLVATFYQAVRQVLTRHWASVAVTALLLAAGIAALTSWLSR